MNRYSISVLLLLGCLIGPTGCSRSDKGEPAPKAAVTPAKTEGTKPAGSKFTGGGLDMDTKATPITPADSGKAKPQP